jgi:hypothetical protein
VTSALVSYQVPMLPAHTRKGSDKQGSMGLPKNSNILPASHSFDHSCRPTPTDDSHCTVRVRQESLAAAESKA